MKDNENEPERTVYIVKRGDWWPTGDCPRFPETGHRWEMAGTCECGARVKEVE